MAASLSDKPGTTAFFCTPDKQAETQVYVGENKRFLSVDSKGI